MVRKLRRKFVITAMTALAIILVGMIAVINIANLVQSTEASDQLLQMLAENDGTFPDVPPQGTDAPEIKPDAQREPGGNAPDGTDRPADPSFSRNAEAPFSTRYFWVRFDAEGNVTDEDTTHIAAISATQAETLAKDIFDSGHEKGYAASVYRYRVKVMDDGGRLIIFKDSSADVYNAQSLLRNSMLLMVVCLGLMYILVRVLSGRAVSPVVESLEKQKQFITDAGHELKTPLAIISADVDVMELDHGKSEWTDSIRNQCRRMTELVQNMLTLSRMEEEGRGIVLSDIDLSAIMRETAAGFQTAAEAAGKQYSVQIEEGVHINGEPRSMTQLLSVLIDNALKYSDAEGNIEVRMKKGREVTVEVSNTCDAIPDGNLDRLFDRFYRADASRSRKTGGFGIGLSAARAIAERYGGTIAAVRDGKNTIRFVVKLPKSGNGNRR